MEDFQERLDRIRNRNKDSFGRGSRFGGGLESDSGDDLFGSRPHLGSSARLRSDHSSELFGGPSIGGDSFGRDDSDFGMSRFGGGSSSFNKVDVFGQTRDSVGLSPFGSPTPQNQVDNRDIYDKTFDGVVKGGKAVAKGTVNVVKMSAEVKSDYKEWDRRMKLGNNMALYSTIQIVISFVLLLVTRMNTLPLIMAHSLMAIGGFIFARVNYLYPEEREAIEDIAFISQREDLDSKFSDDLNMDYSRDELAESEWGTPDFGTRHFSRMDDEDEDDYEDASFVLDEDEDLEEDDVPIVEDDEDDIFANAMSELEQVGNEDSVGDVGVTTEEILSNFKDVPTSLVNRNTLLDAYIQALDGFNKNFGKRIELNFSSPIWQETERKIQAAQKQSGLKLAKSIDDDYEDEDKYSTITKYIQGDLIDEVFLTRPNGLNDSAVTKFNNELTSILKGLGQDANHYVFSNSETSGDTLYVSIFKGVFPAVTLKDLLQRNEVREFMLDSDNAAPVVLGYDEFGKAIMFDLFDLQNMLFAGLARSGKSVTLKSIMSQACMLNSPTQLQLWIGDAKEGGDWTKFRLPHVKKFAENGVKTLEMLRELQKREVPRRVQIIKESGYSTIKAYREANPEVKDVPSIWVVIDEWMNVTGDIKAYDAANGSETFNEYKTILIEIATKYPYLDIRLIGIPHVIKDSAVPKTVTDQITSRALFKSTKTMAESVFDNKKEVNTFKYNADGVGLAYLSTPLINNSKLTLLRGALFGIGGSLSDKPGMEKSEAKVLEFQRNLWIELDRESWENSYWHIAEMQEQARRDLGL